MILSELRKTLLTTVSDSYYCISDVLSLSLMIFLL